MDDEIRYLRQLYYELHEIAKIKGYEPFFKVTSKGSKALAELCIPRSKDEYQNFVWNLYIVFYEGSGYGKRIPTKADSGKAIPQIKDYRTYYYHDIEHGKERDVRKKYDRIRKINVCLIGKEVPSQEEDWMRLGNKLIEGFVVLLENLREIKPPTEPKVDLKGFLEDKITLFAGRPARFREIRKCDIFYALAECPIFLPTFYMIPPPRFGNTKSAIHIGSEATNGDLGTFRQFILEIKRLWLQETSDRVLQIERLMPWSISKAGSMIYGSGVENLLEALKSHDLGVITMMLQGFYGEDYSRSFFIIIGNYRKGQFFGDNFIDFYLCNVPMEWDWINRINDSLDILSPVNRKASSYSLKPYFYYEWNSSSDISAKRILGGMGRNGYGNERQHDSFEGLIFEKELVDIGYKLNREDSWYRDPDLPCPVHLLDEFIFSVTNRPPTVQEIELGRLIGIHRPTIYMLAFDGYGHTVYAINGWGTSETQL